MDKCNLNFTSTLSGDSDISLNNLSNGQLLQYNSSSSKWINISPTYISSCSINSCNDATLTSLATNNLLMYDGLKWINSTMSLEMNNDVNVISLTNKNILRWNGLNWGNVADLINAETNISTLQVSTGILVITTNTAQNAIIVTSFSC